MSLELLLLLVIIALILGTFTYAERNRRQDRVEFRALLERIDGNAARIADHTRHIADLVVQNGQAFARVETLTQQILTRLATERAAH